MRDILLAGLRMTPEERAAARAESDAEMARKGAEEMAKYNALSPEEKADYDALTIGMMPRLAR